MVAPEDLNSLIDQIFLEAVELDSSERTALLNARCTGLPAKVRERVEELLAANEVAKRHELSTTNPHLRIELPRLDDQTSSGAWLGAQIGNYVLREKLGEGGMGEVFMAEQTAPISRVVALKLIKPGMDSKEVLARFEAERQALAMMDHPNICRVLDAGSTESGRPFFVMELVKGVPITQYCDEHRLSAKQRLELFISVCQAVAHAHQKGVIHRDIKPSNVLVAEYDDEAVPKIIDFGVAKATIQKLTEKTLFTRYGQLVGTVEYMSPEQANLNQLDVDTRSDIYSLGVLLYELLVGMTPFDRQRLRQAAFKELLRIICEEEPPKPSTRLTGNNDTSQVARDRQVDPVALVHTVRGELDWIVMKSLEKDRKRRYQGASDLARDIERHLNGEAVEAGPPTIRYRAAKFVRRYKAQAIMGCVLLGVLCAASAAGWIFFGIANSALVKEKQSLEVAESQTRIAERRLREAESMRFVVQSNETRSLTPIRSALLAIEAVEATYAVDGTVSPVAKQALMASKLCLGGRPFLGHGQSTVWRSVASAGSRWVIAADGSLDGVRAWDLEAKNWEVPRLKIPTKATQVAISPNQRWIATGAEKDGIRLWSLETFGSKAPGATDCIELTGKTEERVDRIIVSDDSRWLVASFKDGAVAVWDLEAPNPASSYKRLNGSGNWTGHAPIDISADGRWLASGTNKVVHLWDLEAEDPHAQVRVFAQQQMVHAISISHDGRWIALGSTDNFSQLIDTKHEDSEPATHVLGRQHSSLAFVADGRFLITSGFDNKAHAYDLTGSGSSLTMITIRGTQGHLEFSPRERWMIDPYGPSIRLYDCQSLLRDIIAASETKKDVVDLRVPDAQFRTFDQRLHSCVFTSDERWLITTDAHDNMRRWNLATDHASESDTIDAFGVQLVAASPNGKWLLVGCGRNGQRSSIWRLDGNGRPKSKTVLENTTDGIGTVVFSPDSRWMVSISCKPVWRDVGAGDRDPFALVWDLHDGKLESPKFVLNHPKSVKSVAISGDSKQVVTSCEDGTVRLWDLPTGTLKREFIYEEVVRSIAISSSGDRLAAAVGKDQAYVLDTATGISHRLRGPKNYVMQIKISSNDRWIASSAGQDDLTYVWDLWSDEPFMGQALPSDHLGMVVGVAFSPNSKHLATGSWYEGPVLWDLQSADLLASARPVHDEPIQSLSFDASGHELLSITFGRGGQRQVRVFDLTHTDSITNMVIPITYADSVARIPDTSIVVTAGNDVVQFWDTNSDVVPLLQSVKRLVGRDLNSDERVQFSISD